MDVNRLKLLISNSNTTQKEIAEKLSISQQRFNFYVTGKREPDNEMLLRIADFFSVSTDYLLGSQVEDKFSAKFRENLALYLSYQDLSDEEKVQSDYYDYVSFAEETYPLSLAEACTVAENFGLSLDDLLQDDAENKNSPSADEAAPRDEIDEEIMRFVGEMSLEQKDFLIALLNTTVSRNQGMPAFGQASVGAEVP